MVLVLGGSTYAFSTMLLAFLVGIGFGGLIGGGLSDRVFASRSPQERGGRARVLRRLVWLHVGVAALSWAGMYAYGELPFAYVRLYTQLEQAPEWIWPGMLTLALIIMMPPALLMGATFPFLVCAAVGHRFETGAAARPVGWLYGVNTIGAVIGAAAGGLILLPAINVRGTVLLAGSFNLIAALAAVWLTAGARLESRTSGKIQTWRLAGPPTARLNHCPGPLGANLSIW